MTNTQEPETLKTNTQTVEEDFGKLLAELEEKNRVLQIENDELKEDVARLEKIMNDHLNHLNRIRPSVDQANARRTVLEEKKRKREDHDEGKPSK